MNDKGHRRVAKGRRKFQCPVPSTLAIVLSSFVLLSYAFCLLGVVFFLDQDSDESARHLQVRKGGKFLYTESIEGEDEDGQSDKYPFDSSDVYIPKAKWPVSLRDEVGNFETIKHPADPEKFLTVPSFWSPPIHENGLMSRATAMRIGSCEVPDDKGEYARGADCPIHQRTIFLMIASYRDFQCRETIESIYGRAMYPSRIRVGVVDQIIEGTDNRCTDPIKPCMEDPEQALCKYAHLIDAVTLDAHLSVGPSPARHVGHRMYRGEYYAVQSDAHVSFVVNWEMSLIHELESTGNDMAVMSTYLSDFYGSIDEDGNSKKKARPIMCNSRFQWSKKGYHIHHSTQPESYPKIHGSPQMHPWWSAGFSFSRGHFFVNVPYDWLQPMVFSGEEMSIAIRGFTIGYDYYTPEKSVCFHHYAESKEGKEKRKNVPTFWENTEDYEELGILSMRRMLGIVHMNPDVDKDTWDHTDEDRYGLGGVRKPEQLFSLLGIDVENHTMEGHLCHFVDSGDMHVLLSEHLRDDGMGIDYSSVTYQWQDDKD